MLPYYSYMKYYFLFLIIFSNSFNIYSQSNNDTSTFVLGATKVYTIVQSAPPLHPGIYFLSVHENEQTGIKAATDFIDQNGGSFLHLVHGVERNIQFSFRDTNYVFDPNRIFSKDGRRKTLDTLGLFSASADSIVAAFSEHILEMMPNPILVIAIHNNTNENFSIKSYKKGQIYAGDAARIYINKKLDADDFILTTDLDVFKFMQQKRLNVILQDNAHCTDDGSLSVYFGKKGIAYINIEAEHGHAVQQTVSLEAAAEWINTIKKMSSENSQNQ